MNASREISKEHLSADPRPTLTRLSDWLFLPSNFVRVLVGMMVLEVATAALWPFWLLTDFCLWIYFTERRFRMPLRMPKDLGGLDHTDVVEQRVEESRWFGLGKHTVTRRASQRADGIMYFGSVRSQDPSEEGREVWATNSDCRTHMSLAGTTGSGKSETLKAIAYNAICWGSGLIFADGKAANDLAYNLWCLARLRGREDDVLVANFLTGGRDPFESFAKVGRGATPTMPHSNSTNPFADGEASFLLQLLASLLPKASGDGASWQTKAINMIDALIRALCYKRARGELEISIGTIRHYLALENLVTFYIEGRDGKLPELAYLPIKAYFETALPGFQPSLANQPEKWDVEVRNQHGYLTGQFSRILAMMMDTYGFVFQDRFGEIDMADVMLNNRILVVLIPSMEKSAEEASALGKLFIASIRLMLAQNLGHELEGTRREILDVKATNTPHPFPVITDELGYYFAAGMSVVYAQARALGVMMIAGFQDVQALKRGEASDEFASLFANTKIKWCLALEDPDDTFDLFRKAGGQEARSVLAGYDRKSGLLVNGWGRQDTSRIEMRDRIDVRELRDLSAGQGVMLFKDAVVRMASFYIPQSRATSLAVKSRINRFLQVPMPSHDRLPPEAVEATQASRGQNLAEREIAGLLYKSQAPYYKGLEDPILDAVAAAARHMNALPSQRISSEERAIVLFEAARRALREARKAPVATYWHKPVVKPVVEIEDDYPEIIE